jgi:hypothetical protein
MVKRKVIICRHQERCSPVVDTLKSMCWAIWTSRMQRGEVAGAGREARAGRVGRVFEGPVLGMMGREAAASLPKRSHPSVWAGVRGALGMVGWRWGRGVWGSVSRGEERLAVAVAGAKEEGLASAMRRKG